MKPHMMIWAILGIWGLALFTMADARAADDKLPKPKKLVQVQKKIKALEKEIKLIEKGKHEAVKKQTEECDALGEKVDEAEKEWEEAAKKLDKKTSKELLKRVKAEPDKRISEIMTPPEGMSKSDFYICVGVAKKLVELQNRYEKMDEALVSQMKKVIDDVKKKLAKPREEIADLLAEYQEAVLLDALSGCKEYKDKKATFPVEELAKHVSDLQKTYQDDFDWTEDDVWKALEDTWETARPCIPKSERKKADTKKTAKAGKSSESATSSRTVRGEKGRKAGDRMVRKIRGVEFAFRWCPPGKFMMGSPSDEKDRKSDEGPQHEVTLTKGFWMLETEVTQAMWLLVMGNNPSKYQGANRPVECVNWDDCQEFCRRLSGALKLNICLPTEAQWEYACRAGTTTAYYWGDDEGLLWKYGNYCDRSNTNHCNYQDRIHNDGHDKTAPVRSYKPNAWGLYDMYGNVKEWCQDWYGDYPKGSVTDPTGPNSGMVRALRSGGWYNPAKGCRSASRYSDKASIRYDFLGVRPIAYPSK